MRTGGSAKSGAFFKAAGAPLRPVQPKQPPALPEGWTQPNPEWQAWFDHQICDICKKPHPTKYHNDPKRQNCPFKISDAKSWKLNHNLGDKRNDLPHNELRVKRDQKEEFKKRVYKLFVCLDEEDDESSKSSEEVEQYINIADTNDADKEPSHKVDDDDDDSRAMALASMGLDSLLNYRAASSKMFQIPWFQRPNPTTDPLFPTWPSFLFCS
jgi:hypothetical protein